MQSPKENTQTKNSGFWPLFFIACVGERQM